MGRVSNFCDPNEVQVMESGMREGVLLWDDVSFKVHKGEEKAGQDTYAAAVKMIINCIRLDDDLKPMKDDEGNVETTVLNFSFGSKSLEHYHPCNITGPDDNEPSDCGGNIGACGNSVMDIPGVTPQKVWISTGFKQFMYSLSRNGWKSEFLFPYAPFFKGAIVYMKNQSGMMGVDGKLVEEKDKNKKPTNYKVVDKILRAPYEMEGFAGSKTVTVVEVAADVIGKLEKKKYTLKAFKNAAISAFGDGGYPEKLMAEFIGLVSKPGELAGVSVGEGGEVTVA